MIAAMLSFLLISVAISCVVNMHTCSCTGATQHIHSCNGLVVWEGVKSLQRINLNHNPVATSLVAKIWKKYLCTNYDSENLPPRDKFTSGREILV